MNGFLKKLLTWLVLPAIIVALVYAIVTSILKPVNFNKETARRSEVAVQRLKDIRTLQVMEVIMQIGSQDDSLAVAHTEAVKKANRKITPAELYQMYLNGDKNLVFAVANKIPVRDTLFNGRDDFNIDSLKYIPFSGKAPVQMEAVTKQVSGVQVPLFEAKMPYRLLLKGLDNQLRINLDAERRDQNRYEGLQVGSISAPNNNAGNWE